ncbi:MAG: FxsA protein [Armatimonadetes bacterium]|jgi:UPF0716 protein FxsA|nr:FxsA protein [Armatimonadota bacterium]
MRVRVFPLLSALFIGFPLLDSLMLIVFGRYLGFWPTVGMVLLSGFAGAGLAKSQGIQVLRGIQRDLSQGQVPAQGLMDAVIILVAGGMLMSPGFLTDIVGLGLLLPAVRRPIKAVLRKRAEQMIRTHQQF